jgi:hypothetical protein
MLSITSRRPCSRLQAGDHALDYSSYLALLNNHHISGIHEMTMQDVQKVQTGKQAFLCPERHQKSGTGTTKDKKLTTPLALFAQLHTWE